MAQPDPGNTWTQWEDDSSNKNMAVAAVLTSAVAAAVIAFVLRRARKEQEEARTPAGLAGKAYERTRDMVGDDRLEAGREFLMAKIVPEFKPVLLSVLEEIEDAVQHAFRRAEWDPLESTCRHASLSIL